MRDSGCPARGPLGTKKAYFAVLRLIFLEIQSHCLKIVVGGIKWTLEGYLRHQQDAYGFLIYPLFYRGGSLLTKGSMYTTKENQQVRDLLYTSVVDNAYLSSRREADDNTSRRLVEKERNYD
jgi:hypothetical protein